MSEFEEYIRHGEPQQVEKTYAWQTAIGLQQVDGLVPSEYLLDTAKLNIEGEITFAEVKNRIDKYYEINPVKDPDDRTAEADEVSARIAEVVIEKSFTFSPTEYISIHKRIFEATYTYAGILRDHNISKNEWVLGGASVYYAGFDTITDTLNYDFEREKSFSYNGLGKVQTVRHIEKFISGLWQIHAFREGNTRTTAVFTIKYLRTFGFDVTNDIFQQNAWYFRNALVRANYNNIENGVHATQEYLDRFFDNLLFDGKYALKNRYLHISLDNGSNFVREDVATDEIGDDFCVNDTVNENIEGNDTVNEDVKGNDTVNDTVNENIEGNDTVNDTVNENVGGDDTVNDTVKSILISISENPNITVDMLTGKIGKSRSTILRHLKLLKNQNVIRRVGSDKTGHWELTNTQKGERL